MRTFFISPRWLALHLVALVLVASFAALGWWQLEVFRESQARQVLREMPPVALDTLTAPGQPLAAATDRAVTAEGQYVDELVVLGRVGSGVLGAFAVATLATDTGYIIVARGWGADPDDFPPVPPGTTTVTGHLLASESPDQATGGPLAGGQIGYLAPSAVADATGLEAADFFDGYLLLGAELPIPSAHPERLELDVLAPIRNVSIWQNLSYWAQWWIFAGAVMVFWVSIIRNGLKRARAQDAPPEPSPQPSARR